MDDTAPGFALDSPAGPVPAGRPRYLAAAGGYEHLGVNLRTVFRWLKMGDKHADWPPLDCPSEIEEWWQRMRDRGEVKNNLQSAVRQKIAAYLSGDDPPAPSLSPPVASARQSPPAAGPATAASAPSVSSVQIASLAEQFDPEAEIRAFESRLVALRQARDEAYQQNQRSEGDALDRQYTALLTEYTVVSKRVTEQLRVRGDLIPRAAVESDLAPRIIGIAAGGMYYYAQLAPALAAAPDMAAQNAIWRDFWREKSAVLFQSRFVPPGLRDISEKLWAEILAFIDSRQPAALSLSAG